MPGPGDRPRGHAPAPCTPTLWAAMPLQQSHRRASMRCGCRSARAARRRRWSRSCPRGGRRSPSCGATCRRARACVLWTPHGVRVAWPIQALPGQGEVPVLGLPCPPATPPALALSSMWVSSLLAVSAPSQPRESAQEGCEGVTVSNDAERTRRAGGVCGFDLDGKVLPDAGVPVWQACAGRARGDGGADGSQAEGGGRSRGGRGEAARRACARGQLPPAAAGAHTRPPLPLCLAALRLREHASARKQCLCC